MSFLENLPKPFFVLAPMDDVTDTVFRQIIAGLAPPDLYFTEFVSVDGLQSPGRDKLLPKLRLGKGEKNVIAQLWGLKPENYYKTVSEIVDGSLVAEANWARNKDRDSAPRNPHPSEVQGSQEKRTKRINDTLSESRTQLTQQFAGSTGKAAGFAGGRPGVLRFSGVDVNMGCPVKTVIKNGACAALINNRGLAGEIIDAVREAAAGHFPVSVKTRVGFNAVDMSWIEFLLNKKILDMLSIHGRAAKQMSKIPADWELIGQARRMRDSLSPDTKIVGNGDIMSRAQGEKLAKQYGLDGIMAGRGIFHNPLLFSKNDSWKQRGKEERIGLYREHISLFDKTWQKGARRIETLNKFCKVYINGFEGAKELREELMRQRSADGLLEVLKNTQSAALAR